MQWEKTGNILDAEKQARIAADDALGKRIDAAEVEQMTPVKLTDDDKTASRQPVASGTRSLAFGPGAKATANQSVALGAFSQTSSRGNTVSVGSDTLKRRIENVEAGQMDNDVVIMSQLANVGGIPDLWFADSWGALITLSTTDNTLTTDASKIIANADDGVYKLRPAVSFAYSEVESEFAESPINNTGSGSNAILFINSINIGNKSYKLMYFSTRSGGYKINEPNALSTMEWFYVLIDMTVNLPTGKIVRYAPHLTGNTPIKVNYDKTAISLSLSLDTTRGGIDISDNGLYATTATQAVKGIVQGSDSIVITDGIAKVNPSIFGDGLATTDGKVSVDTGFVGEHLAGDALYYDSTDGLMVKTGTGLHIDNDTLSVDQDTLPLASAGNRGTVKVGKGLTISTDGTLSTSGNLIVGTLTTDVALLSKGVESVVLSTIFDPSNTYLLHARITVVPKSTFAVGTKMTVSTSPIVPRFFHQLVEFFKRNTMCAAITISGSSIYTINNEGFDVTFKEDANGILDFIVSMTNATLSPTQNLVIGSYY